MRRGSAALPRRQLRLRGDRLRAAQRHSQGARARRNGARAARRAGACWCWSSPASGSRSPRSTTPTPSRCCRAWGSWWRATRESYRYLAESIRMHPDQEHAQAHARRRRARAGRLSEPHGRRGGAASRLPPLDPRAGPQPRVIVATLPNPASLLAAQLLSALNHLLRGQPWLRQRLLPFAGRTAVLEVFPAKLTVSVDADGQLLAGRRRGRRGRRRAHPGVGGAGAGRRR